VIFDGHLPKAAQLQMFYQQKLAEGMELLQNAERRTQNAE
jgi:hypothetical protein